MNAHLAATRFGHETVIREFAKTILKTVQLLFGVAIVENECQQPAKIEVLTRETLVAAEARLLREADFLMARLPINEIDLLIVDQIGKEISGTGMDTNVIGRNLAGHPTGEYEVSPLGPRVSHIFVRDLSEQTKGNGIGIGFADFTTVRVVKALDLSSTYVNAFHA